MVTPELFPNFVYPRSPEQQYLQALSLLYVLGRIRMYQKGYREIGVIQEENHNVVSELGAEFRARSFM